MSDAIIIHVQSLDGDRLRVILYTGRSISNSKNYIQADDADGIAKSELGTRFT